jgi:hypothetical protein
MNGTGSDDDGGDDLAAVEEPANESYKGISQHQQRKYVRAQNGDFVGCRISQHSYLGPGKLVTAAEMDALLPPTANNSTTSVDYRVITEASILPVKTKKDMTSSSLPQTA